MASITIKDIARKLNISPSTVSRALRNHPDISGNTKEKVAALAQEFHYQPNLIAQSLQNQKTNTIGVIVPDFKHYFFPSVISGIEEIAYEAGYSLMICQSNESYEREKINTQALISNRVAGLLISIAQETKKTDHLKAVMNHGIPLVFFDRVADELNTHKVVVDDYAGAYKLVEHLIRSGYERIAHLAGPQHMPISLDRLKGYQQALKKHHIPIKKELILEGGLHERDGLKGAKELLTLKQPPDAIFAVNDPVAIGVFSLFKERKIRIPEDIALAGFSNNQISQLLDPPLTTVDQATHEIGKTAASILLEQIRRGKETFTPKTKLIKTELIIRASTQKH